MGKYGSFCGHVEPYYSQVPDFILAPASCQSCSQKCICPPGYKCDGDTLNEPIGCPAGFYQDQQGQTDCKECPIGSFCPTDLTTSPTPCAPGTYCMSASKAQTYCAKGSYQSMGQQGSCITCPLGHYCDEYGMTAPKLCILGRKCDATGLSSPGDCPIGYYCDSVGISLTEVAVAVGGTATIAGRPKPCTPGHYCPINSASEIECSLGTFQPDYQQSLCQPCNPGFLCSFRGLSEESLCPAGFYCVNNLSSLCPPGYYCLTGTSTKDFTSNVVTRPLPCSPGTFCAGGNSQLLPSAVISTSPIYCKPGTYNGSSSASQCLDCPAGKSCNQVGTVTPVNCPPGTYREAGTRPLDCLHCPEGTFNPFPGSTAIESCQSCPAGVVCISAGIARVDNSTSTPCPSGYYCPAGTSRASKADFPCPAGSYCFSGTASLAQAIQNVCPEGRFCPIGTSAQEGGDKNCSVPTTCSLGLLCQTRYYCPAGTEEMKECPPGTVSNTGAGTLTACYRDPDNFYNVSILSTQYASPLFPVSPFSYYLFDLNFLQIYAQARIPEDYQLVAVLEFEGNGQGRQTQSETNNTLRVMIISHTVEGGKHKLPLNLNEKELFQTNSTLTIGLLAAQSALVTFRLEFLDGNFQQTVGWNEAKVRENTMSEREKWSRERGFAAVLTEASSAVYEMPVNLNKIYTVDASGKLQSSAARLESRAFLSLVNFTTDLDVHNFATSITDSEIWQEIPTFQWYSLPYLPFISDCSPGYGSYLPINDLMSDSRCNLISTATPIDPYNFAQAVRADTCSISLLCDYGLNLAVFPI